MLSEIEKALRFLLQNGCYYWEPIDNDNEFEDLVFYIEPILRGEKCAYEIYPNFINLID